METYIPLSMRPSGAILDTDIGPDCDDAGALAVLCACSARCGFPILGVGHCTSNPYGAGCADAIAAFCGRPNLPIGTWPHPGFLDDCRTYNEPVAKKFSKRSRDGIFPAQDAVSLYRRLLEAAPEGDTVMIGIGPLNDLAALLASPGGPELIKSKVRALVLMAASIEKTREYNIVCDASAARAVFGRWPGPIYVSGVELGARLKTGFEPGDVRPGNPIYMAYDLYCKGNNLRASFDLTAVHFAAVGEGKYWSLTPPGRVEFFEDDATRFAPDPSGNVRFLVQRASDEAVCGEFNSILRSF